MMTNGSTQVANAGINEGGNFYISQVVGGKPKKPTTATLDVNIKGVVYSACDSRFLPLCSIMTKVKQPPWLCITWTSTGHRHLTSRQLS